MEDFKISSRLQKVAGLVHNGHVVADVGTDHGYLPIYIVKQGISHKVIAMDVRKGPLQKAQDNVTQYGVKDSIDVRLSDGLDKLEVAEAETITICGMGGKLIQSILEKGKGKYTADTQLILSPQSEIREFRKYIADNGFSVVGEYMLKEEGQYYLIIDCVRDGGKKETDKTDELLCETHLRYGRMLLESKCSCLFEYLGKELQVATSVLEKVTSLNSSEPAIADRIARLQYDIDCINRAYEYYK